MNTVPPISFLFVQVKNFITMRKTIAYLWALFLAVAAPHLLFGADIKANDEIIIDQPVSGNQYLTGGKIKVMAPIDGDLIAAGGELWVQDSISDDVTLAGGNIVINGPIGGDLRLMSGNVKVKSDIWGDLVVAGGEIDIEKGVIIYGDIITAGGELHCGATVMGSARIAAGEFDFDGVIRQNAFLRAGKLNLDGKIGGESELIAENITLGESAIFWKKVNYWTPEGEIDFTGHLADGAVAEFDESMKSKLDETSWRYFGLGFLGYLVFRVLAAALLILLLILLFNRFFTRAAGALQENWNRGLGYGALLFIGLPVAGLIAMITLIGLPVGLLMFSVWGVALILGHALSATVLAYEWEAYRNTDLGKGQLLLLGLGIFLAMKLIGLIPFVGQLINTAILLITFGLVLNAWWNPREPAPEVAEDEVV